MSAGKIAAQSFQAAQRLFAAAQTDPDLYKLLQQWQEDGTCTRTRIALSQAVFERACRELPGALMIDEGVTEVDPGSATVFATAPLDENNPPQILRHKRIPVLNAPVNHTSVVRPAAVAQWSSSRIYALTDESSILSGCVPPAREAEMDQHRPESDGSNDAQAPSVGGAEVAGSMPAAGFGLRVNTAGCLRKEHPGSKGRATVESLRGTELAAEDAHRSGTPPVARFDSLPPRSHARAGWESEAGATVFT